MKNLKKSKNSFKEFNSINRCYLVFTFFNINLSVLNLIKLTIEEDYGFKIFKINKSSNCFDVFVEIETHDYLEDKEDLIEFFLNEDFKFLFICVYYNKNYFQPDFFENEILSNFYLLENLEDIFVYLYVSFLLSFIEKQKVVFLLQSILLSNIAIMSNVNNTSGSF